VSGGGALRDLGGPRDTRQPRALVVAGVDRDNAFLTLRYGPTHGYATSRVKNGRAFLGFGAGARRERGATAVVPE
jgi:hypothetical protein